MLSALLFTAPVAPALGSAQQSERSIGREDFFEPGMAPVRRSGAYDVTVVYFMDYQCPACRRFTPDVARALAEDKRVRVIYRDTPIFGARSEEAARLAVASQFQGRHEAFHHALMTTKGQLDEPALRAAADKAGVDWARLQSDLDKRSEEIDRLIAWNLDLSQAAGISGTPAFVIGETLADGALDYHGLKAEIVDARAAAGVMAPEKPSAEPAEEVAEKAAAEPVPISAEAKQAAGNAAPAEAAETVFKRSQPPAAAEPIAAQASTGPSLLWLAGLGGLAGLVLLFGVARRRSARRV